ncbi:luciferin 4-monooxygenase [Drosophila mojavensis]|uniref:AMP-dependent synthetase/ligase domain-containing protein n=1 Tax=Drosophila mojavensis TaxID=7230 RepID=B4K4S9_DROMO|nr:luciferin 4-monooxygenase [Drosophila mojavensis]EDW16082.1 uncharacterized protein Dmoj_GI22426 [Drosophila mojavensis]
MLFKPEITYDAEHKVWGAENARDYFAPDLSIGEIIFHEMRRHPQLIAQISESENTVLTREELHLNSMRVASYLRSLGLLQSDVVGIIARNTTHIFAVTYGCFFNGIPFHAVNMIFDEAAIKHLFNITKPRLIFCDGDEYEKVKAATENLKVKIVTMRNHPIGSIKIDEVLATPIEENFKPSRLEQGNNQTLAILCSSGTTRIPKAVTISNSRKILSAALDLTTSDVQYAHSTLDWFSGFLTTVTSGVFSTKRIISDIPFDPVRFLRIVEQHKVTWCMHSPLHLALTGNSPELEKTDMSSIRTFLYGGARCSLEAQQKIRSRLHQDGMNLAYGLTEIGAVTINFHFDQKPNSCGRPVDGKKIKIIAENGDHLGPNEVGEVCVRSGQYWAGYYGNPEETQNVLDSEQWFYTGDLGYMDDDGFLYIVDRKKEMLKYQSYKYFPNEIEDVISQMPDVVDVCVFGIWDPMGSDKAAAAVVKKVGSQLQAQDIVDYVRKNIPVMNKHLHGGAIIVDDLKRSPNGKTNRKATKEYFLKLMESN